MFHMLKANILGRRGVVYEDIEPLTDDEFGLLNDEDIEPLTDDDTDPLTDKELDPLADDDISPSIDGFEDQTPASNIASIASKFHSAGLSLPKLTARERKPIDLAPRSNIKIDSDIARIILGRDETLNPNSALLQKLRPHLAVSRREEAPSTRAEAERTFTGGVISDAPTFLAESKKEYQRFHSFALDGPLEKASFALLVVLTVSAMAGFVTLAVKKRRANSFSRV
jgi:hypothetical protein